MGGPGGPGSAFSSSPEDGASSLCSNPARPHRPRARCGQHGMFFSWITSGWFISGVNVTPSTIRSPSSPVAMSGNATKQREEAGAELGAEKGRGLDPGLLGPKKTHRDTFAMNDGGFGRRIVHVLWPWLPFREHGVRCSPSFGQAGPAICFDMTRLPTEFQSAGPLREAEA